MSKKSDASFWQRPGDSDPSQQTSSASAQLVDPEDDLPSADYAGDFETTTIPPYEAGGSGAGTPGFSYSILGDQEPLPYAAPSSGRHSLVGPADATDADDARVRAAGRRGTQDFGLLLLRAGLGALLVIHGLQKLMGWWGGPGIAGFKNVLSGFGYQHADILSYVASGGEIIAGVLLVLGLFTPLVAAGVLAYLLNGLVAVWSAQPDWRHLPFFLPGGQEFRLVLIGMAIVIILTGPGRYGLDGGRGWARRPFIGSALALLLGIGGGVAVWVLLNGTNPLS